jgi:integrase
MSADHSTPAPVRDKPAKPYPDFPLFPHAAGVWVKKIRGKLHYFGPWDDPDGALKKYLEQKDALHAGRKPREDPEGFTVKELANRFLNAKQTLVDAGELSPRTWTDYKDACDEIVAAFSRGRLLADLGPDDFAALRNRMARKWGPHRLGKAIQCVRCAFKHADEAGLIDRPMRYGPGFKRPSKKTLRLDKAKKGPKLFTASEVHALVEGALVVGEDGPKLVQAGVQLRAMLLLGVNCALGNADVGNLPLSAVDLETGWLSYPRVKTGLPRKCPLWPETIAALREALAKRPEPKDPSDIGLFFVTKYGERWAKADNDNPVSKETRKLLDAIGINGRKGLGFYTLRHVFRTVADESKDQPAVDFIMGHEVVHMSSVYRETISDARLKAVAEHVRGWLFAERGTEKCAVQAGEQE